MLEEYIYISQKSAARACRQGGDQRDRAVRINLLGEQGIMKRNLNLERIIFIVISKYGLYIYAHKSNRSNNPNKNLSTSFPNQSRITLWELAHLPIRAIMPRGHLYLYICTPRLRRRNLRSSIYIFITRKKRREHFQLPGKLTEKTLCRSRTRSLANFASSFNRRASRIVPSSSSAAAAVQCFTAAGKRVLRSADRRACERERKR